MPTYYDTGYKYPSSTGFSISPYGTGNQWSSATGAYVEDGTTYALMTDNSVLYKYQSYGAFDFGIPEGYSISGMEVKLAGDAEATEVGGFMFYCASNGNWYQDQSNFFDGTPPDDVFTYGMQTAPMTASDFSNANFKVAIFSGSINNGKIIGVDYIKIKVYYYLPDDIDLSVSEAISVGESTARNTVNAIHVTEPIPVGEEELRIYDGIAYNRALSTVQLINEYIPRMDLSWRFRLNGGTPEGKTPRLGN
jgi:hypothetical protein